MLRFLRRSQRWLMAVLIGTIGVVFAVFIGVGAPLRRFGGHGEIVVGVGPYLFGPAEFGRERARWEAQYRESLGKGFDAKAMEKNLDGLAAQVLANRALMALEAEDLGLAVAKPEIERAVRPSFAKDGRIDRDAFRQFVEYEYGSETAFVRDQRLELLARKLLRVASGQAHVSEGEARDAVRRRLEAVQIAFPVLDGAKVPDGAVAEEAVAAFLASRDADARALYDEHKDRYDVPEQVRARHILIRLASDAPPDEVAAAEQKAQAALARVRAGEDFAKVAGETSDDAGSKADGGDLGFFRRGQMVKAFEDAAFGQAPGELGEPVRSEFGIHLIRVEEKRSPQRHPYEEVREDLAREILGREAARAAARATADRIAEAVRGGKSVEQAARDAGLTLERSGWLRRRPDGYVPGLGAAPELLAVAFALEPGASSDRVFEVDEKLALVQVLDRREPAPDEIEPAVEAERRTLEQKKLDAQLDAWIGARRSELLDAGEIAIHLDQQTPRRARS